MNNNIFTTIIFIITNKLKGHLLEEPVGRRALSDHDQINKLIRIMNLISSLHAENIVSVNCRDNKIIDCHPVIVSTIASYWYHKGTGVVFMLT